VEEMVPHRDERPCPDLKAVAKPMKDWPENISAEDKQYWYERRRAINVCRAEEVLRREKVRPGSVSAGAVELSWMVMDSLRNQPAKVDAIYQASRETGVPPHVLTGAIYQESLFAELGIADDGGNYSCGMQQINLEGWCLWANKQKPEDKQAMGWPQQPVPCEDKKYVSLGFIRPVYEIAKTRLNGLPEYRLNKRHFANIPLDQFVYKWPEAAPQVQRFRYQLIQSYVNHCSDARKGIMAKANELAAIYQRYVPESFQQKDRYSGSERFKRACREKQSDNAYPLHAGWLLAVAAYNAGPRAMDNVAHYNRWRREDWNNPRVVAGLEPSDIVASLYWGGKYNPRNDMIEFNSLKDGEIKSWTWFKGCVAQRHIARVMQHVTLLPEFFVDSLEGAFPCARSEFDGSGNLIKTAVPPARQASPGVRR
jgi:hypothetical protein